MIAILPAGFVVSRAPRNNLVHLEATFVALAGFPVSFAINLVATFSMEPCRRQGVLGLVGIAPAYLVTVPLFVLAVLGRISARCEAAVKAGLVVWFAAFAVAAVGVVRHGGHWEEIVRLVALLGFCALLVAAVVGFGLFCYAKMGRRRPGADTAFFVWFSLWIVLYPISATAHVGGWSNWYDRRKDVTAVAVFLVSVGLSVAFAVDAAREDECGKESEPLLEEGRRVQRPAAKGLPPI